MIDTLPIKKRWRYDLSYVENNYDIVQLRDMPKKLSKTFTKALGRDLPKNSSGIRSKRSDNGMIFLDFKRKDGKLYAVIHLDNVVICVRRRLRRRSMKSLFALYNDMRTAARVTPTTYVAPETMAGYKADAYKYPSKPTVTVDSDATMEIVGGTVVGVAPAFADDTSITH